MFHILPGVFFGLLQIPLAKNMFSACFQVLTKQLIVADLILTEIADIHCRYMPSEQELGEWTKRQQEKCHTIVIHWKFFTPIILHCLLVYPNTHLCLYTF